MNPKIFEFFAESKLTQPLRSIAGGYTPIFMLHRLEDESRNVEGVSAAYVRRCLEYVRKHRYVALSLEELCLAIQDNEALPDRSVVFTIDDGFKDQIDIGGKVFGEFDIPLTCFVITNFIDGKIWPWDDQVHYILEKTKLPHLKVRYPDGSEDVLVCGEQDNLAGYRERVRSKLKSMNQSGVYTWIKDLYKSAEVDEPNCSPAHYLPASWDEIHRYVKSGHSVAAHTCNHKILSKLGDEESGSEIRNSISRLNEMVTKSANVFAYPTGRLSDFGEREIKVLQDFGVLGCVSTEAVAVTAKSHIQALPRFSLPENFSNFIQYLSYIEALKDKVR